MHKKILDTLIHFMKWKNIWKNIYKYSTLYINFDCILKLNVIIGLKFDMVCRQTTDPEGRENKHPKQIKDQWIKKFILWY